MIAGGNMVLSLSTAMQGGWARRPAASAPTPSALLHFLATSHSSSFRSDFGLAIAGSWAGVGEGSESSSRESFADIGNPFFLQQQARPVLASKNAVKDSDSCLRDSVFLSSPAPATAGHSGSLVPTGENNGYGGTRDSSIGLGILTNSGQAFREGSGAVKSYDLPGVMEVLASTDGSELNALSEVGPPDPITFILISALLLFVFWLGNYVAPDLIFKNTVFKKSSEGLDSNSADVLETALSDEGRMETSEGDLSDKKISKNESGESGRVLRKVGTGFGAGVESQSKKAQRK